MATKKPLRTNSKVLCAKCHEPIADSMVKAMGLAFHPGHFTCAHCDQPITDEQFLVKDGKPYCERDYKALFLKVCAKCGQPITGAALLAMDRSWHPEHFTCVGCGRKLDGSFNQHEGSQYCGNCYKNLTSPKCHSCGRPVSCTALVAMGRKYHPDCFRCEYCKTVIKENMYSLKNDKIACPECSKKK